MDADELPPRHGLLPLRGRWDAVVFENVPYRLVTDGIAQIDQRPHDAVVAPRAILSGHPYHQGFERLVNPRTANWPVWLGGVNQLIDERAVPGENRVRRGNRRALFQGLLAQLLANFGKFFAIAVRQLPATAHLLAEDTVLRCKVCMAQPELFVNRRGD